MGKLAKYLCCFDLTLAARLIGFVGLAISILLTTVLISDKFGRNYDTSRHTALALGLDWQHFHINANASHHADPEGSLISSIVVFYSVLYLLTSILLIYATISYNRCCTVPWLLCELFGCVSKSVGMIFHALDNCDHIGNLFVIGSICYIVLMMWWWVVVFTAQSTWKARPQFSLHFALNPKPSVSIQTNLDNLEEGNTPLHTGRPPLLHARSVIDSPIPYEPNHKYCEI